MLSVFIDNVKTMDISSIEDYILNFYEETFEDWNKHDWKAIIAFSSIDGFNIERIQNLFTRQFIEISKDYSKYDLERDELEDLIRDFVSGVKGIDIEKLQNDVLESKSYHAILILACVLENIDVEKFENAFIDISNRDSWYYDFDRFAQRVKGANKEKLQEIVINNAESREMYFFALCVEGADVEKLKNAIIKKCDDADTMLEFARYVLKSFDEDLYNAILKTGDEHYIKLFEEEFNVNGNKKTL